MTQLKSPPNAALTSILFAAFIAASPAGYADYFPFRVAFENVAGVTELTSGNVSKGIEILKRELDDDKANRGYILSSLCGAYVIDSSFEEASQVCSEAVETFPGEGAYNNRGVLRVLTGDFKGAKEDFDRARPERMSEYLDYLKTRNAVLIADANFGLLERLAAKHSPLDVESPVAATAGADIEHLAD